MRTTDPCDPCRTLSLFSCHSAITFVYENHRRLVSFVVVSLTNGLDNPRHLYERLEIENIEDSEVNAVRTSVYERYDRYKSLRVHIY